MIVAVLLYEREMVSLQSNLVFLANLSHCCDLRCLYKYLNFKIVWTAAVSILIQLSPETHHHINRLHDVHTPVPLPASLAQSCAFCRINICLPIIKVLYMAEQKIQKSVRMCSGWYVFKTINQNDPGSDCKICIYFWPK